MHASIECSTEFARRYRSYADDAKCFTIPAEALEVKAAKVDSGVAPDAVVWVMVPAVIAPALVTL